jgi:hypothetical protein
VRDPHTATQNHKEKLNDKKSADQVRARRFHGERWTTFNFCSERIRSVACSGCSSSAGRAGAFG